MAKEKELLRYILFLSNARLGEILGWIVVVRENVSVFRQANRKERIEIVFSGFFLFFFQMLHLAFTAFI